MGTQLAQNSGDLGLDNFFKQVLWPVDQFALILLFFPIKLDFYQYSYKSKQVNFYFVFVVVLICHFLFCCQVQEIEKNYEKLDKLLKKLQV